MRRKKVVASRFELVERIGQGGFGEVWQAKDLWLRQVVALKLLTDNDDARRFAGEVIDLRPLPKDRFISVFDYVRDGNLHAFSMELMSAPWVTLDEFVEKVGSKMSAQRRIRLALRVAEDLLESLGTLHDGKTVHRDIKPENIFIESTEAKRVARGSPVVPGPPMLKVGDLGIAAALDSKKTVTLRAGSPDWHAPEQMVRYAKAARQLDIYAAALVVHYVLTGGEILAKEARGGKVAIRNALTESLRSKHLAHRLAEPLARATRENPALRFPTASKALAAFLSTVTPNELMCLDVLSALPPEGLKKDEMADRLFPVFAAPEGWENRTRNRLAMIHGHIEEFYRSGFLVRSGLRYQLS